VPALEIERPLDAVTDAVADVRMQQVDAGLENMEKAATSLFDEFS
jgi:hypothetical protein